MAVAAAKTEALEARLATLTMPESGGWLAMARGAAAARLAKAV